MDGLKHVICDFKRNRKKKQDNTTITKENQFLDKK